MLAGTFLGLDGRPIKPSIAVLSLGTVVAMPAGGGLLGLACGFWSCVLPSDFHLDWPCLGFKVGGIAHV